MEEEYKPADIEQKWQAAWADSGAFVSDIDEKKSKFYCLEMYPYPSGKMHMGHVRNYSIGDAVARFRRATGDNVIYPMGFDSFGMPAENAAIDEGGHPLEIIKRNIAMIKTDFAQMGFSHDWNRELMSHDENYYRWNQLFFLKFLEKGLAYRAFAEVNWCTGCQTVLAKEQVHNERCWRCKTEVVGREMDQWFLKITDYSQELWDDLDNIDYPANVKALQRDWIGRSEGALIKFPVADEDGLVIETFTTRPDTIFGVTFVTLAPTNPLCEQLTAGTEYEAGWRELRNEVEGLSDKDIGQLKEKKGVFLGRFAINPLSGEKIPIYAGNFVIASYGTGSVMAVPGHDQRDYDFAKRYEIPIRRVLIEDEGDDPDAELDAAFEGYGPMVNSADDGFDGLSGEAAKNAVISALEAAEAGGSQIQFKMHDWLISRQRYWGTPIPIVHCEKCGCVPVKISDLPVVLPLDVEFTIEGNPLETSDSFTKTDCPSCGESAVRDSDTMDTFVDSSWYFLRYTDSKNIESCFANDVADYWMNVDFYCGGIEHAQMHLIYARFWTKALRDLGFHGIDEPFERLLCQGMVNSQAPFCETCNVDLSVDHRGSPCPHCGNELTERSAKMSKSLGNTISPGAMVERYGADTVRLFMLFAAQPTAGMDWSDEGIDSNYRQMNNLWNLAHEMMQWGDSKCDIDAWLGAQFRLRTRQWHQAMAETDLRGAVRISHYDIYSDFNWYQRRGGTNGGLAREIIRDWAKMLHIVTPHFAEEWWAELGGDGLIAQQLLTNDGASADGDVDLLAKEAFVGEVIDQARQMKELAERHLEAPAQRAVIQCSEAWKGELCRIGIELQEEGYDMKQALKVIMTRPFAHDAEIRKQVPAIWKRVLKQLYKWSPQEKAMLNAEIDEVATITESAEFISAELGIETLEVYLSGSGEDVGGKAKFAFPLQPGIAYQ